MAKRILALALAGALLAVPTTALGAKGGQGKSKKGGQGMANRCAKTKSVGFQVGGTLVEVTAEGVTLVVTSANSHARKSGELGETYTVPAGDAFDLKLGDDGTLVPAAGDRVKVKGRIALTGKRCAEAGTSLADRYATPNVTRVKVSRPEPEAELEAPPAV